MSRNANWDKAKRQAVGIYRAASPMASINHGEEKYSGGDYRAPEGTKLVYFTGNKAQVPEYNHDKIKRLPPGPRVGSRPRSNSCPQERGTLTASGCRASVPNMRALISWDSYAPAQSVLLPRKAR